MEPLIQKGNQASGHHHRDHRLHQQDQILKDRQNDITYGRIVCDVRKGKKDKHRTRLSMGGNLINYPGDYKTLTADLLTVNILLNSIILMPNAKFVTIKIKDF
jgi:hypothetical protein